MRKLIAAIAFGIMITSCDTNDSKPKVVVSGTHIKTSKTSIPNLQRIKKFLRNHQRYQNSFAFVINMKTPSGRFRFFVIDLSKDKVMDTGLVAHGINSQKGVNGQLVFSNQINSNCSSLGRYRVGEKYKGRFGHAYKLYGLDSSNSNAFKRSIVLHQYEGVPDAEQLSGICYSLGCPMVSPNFFRKIEKLVDSSTKPVLLDIIY